MSPPMAVTEDTPPDMLTGCMALKLVLPNGKKVKMSVERRTPMMDLLVHVTTSHKLSPAAHVLQPYGDLGVLPYKPSTPIGALDTVMVHIVPKSQLTNNQSNKVALKQVSQPFEQSYRIQVSLPRNQLYVLRANGRMTIGDILNEVCREKCLDSLKYSLRHPKELEKPLQSEMTVAEYRHNQLTLVSNRSIPNPLFTADDIINAIQNLNNVYAVDGSSRSLSPDSSVSPVADPPKPLRRKKAPAPKPPSTTNITNNNAKNNNNIAILKEKKEKNEVAGNGGATTIISHSRTSSDSSGYHEASLISDSSPHSNNSSLPDSLPRRSKLEPSLSSSAPLSRSLVNLQRTEDEPPSLKSAVSASNPNLLSRKKRPAPAPPASMRTVQEESSRSLEESLRDSEEQLELCGRDDLPEKCMTLPAGLVLANLPTPEEVESEEGMGVQERGPQEEAGSDSGHDSSDSHELELCVVPPLTFRDEPAPNTTEARSAVLSELTQVISRGATLRSPTKESSVQLSASTLDNFSIQAYPRQGSAVRRSVSHVSLEAKPAPPPTFQSLSSVKLRKTSSELNINKVGDNKHSRPLSYEDSQGLQSLSVLRSILPHISQSQGSLHTIDETDSKLEPKSNKEEESVIQKPYMKNVFVKKKTSEDTSKNEPVVKDERELSKSKQEEKDEKSQNSVEDLPPVTEAVSLPAKATELDTKPPASLAKSTPEPPSEPVRSEPVCKPAKQEREPERETAKEESRSQTAFVKPAISFSTWGERPKRQVSIKSDKDYVFGGVVATASATSDNSPKKEVKEVKKDIKDDKKKPSVYKSLETGNTRPLRQILEDVSRVPVVRSVELKKPYREEWEVQREIRGVDKLTSLFETARLEDKEPVKSSNRDVKIKPEQPEKEKCQVVQVENKKNKSTVHLMGGEEGNVGARYTSVVGIAGGEVVRVRVKTTARVIDPPASSPRQQLLASIRDFSTSHSLRKVRS